MFFFCFCKKKKRSPQGTYLSVGTSVGSLSIYDIQSLKEIRCLKSHDHRIGVLAWNKSLLCSGSRDRNIVVHDLREANDKIVVCLNYHRQEVCGLKWSFDSQYLASGGNDNKVKFFVI